MNDLSPSAHPIAVPLEIRPAQREDWPGIWALIEPMIREGETYPLDRDLGEGDARTYWHQADNDVFVAIDPKLAAPANIVGSYFLRPNSTGPAAHVATAGYAVHPDHRRRGVATALCNHSLDEAQTRGFRAMQYNLVVATNVRAVRLWQYLRFVMVGTLPGAFRHPTEGYVDAYVMYRSLIERS